MVEKLASGEMVTRRRIGTFQIPPIFSERDGQTIALFASAHSPKCANNSILLRLEGSPASSAPIATYAPAQKKLAARPPERKAATDKNSHR